MIHELKITKEYFEKILKGEKPYEIRKDDRGYKKGDFLALNEIKEVVPFPEYTGRSALVSVKEVFSDPDYCKEGYVILTIAPCGVTMKAPWLSPTVLEQRG